MGLLYRCSSCAKDMVLESYHRGRTVPCPRCRASNEIPQNLDFTEVDEKSRRDSDRGARLMTLAVAGFAACCLPLSGYVWWAASGAIHRAREEQREVDPLLLTTRLVAAIGTLISGIAVVTLGGWALASGKV